MGMLDGLLGELFGPSGGQPLPPQTPQGPNPQGMIPPGFGASGPPMPNGGPSPFGPSAPPVSLPPFQGQGMPQNPVIPPPMMNNIGTQLPQNIVGSPLGAPPHIPPPNPGAGGPPTPPGGGQQPQFQTQDTMRSALGLNPTSNQTGQSFEAALAGGLKDIQGNGRFASFARGLGGGLQGGLTQDQQNLRNNMSVQQQWHNDISNDFKNTQLLRQTDANVLWRANQGAYFQARAANQDPNNPARIIQDIDRLEPQREQQARLALQAEHPNEAIDPNELKARIKAARDQAYQSRGLDPNQVQAVKDRGMAIPQKFSDVPKGSWYYTNGGKPVKKTGDEKIDPSAQVTSIPSPFDANKMTDDQFHANVPVNGWVIPRGGDTPKIRREGPPSDWRGAQSALTTPNLDDQAAVYAANQP